MRILIALLAVALSACVHAPGAAAKRIEEASYLPIGGIDQWVTIRGDDASKPLLLLVHGGPGDVQSPFVATYAPYEKDFVLVQWDQRGAGRTFEKLGAQTPDLTLEQEIADGVELAEKLRARFPKQKLILLGHSWGTILGTGMVQKKPELFDAYVGTGQVASWSAVVMYQAGYLMGAADPAKEADRLAKLKAMGTPDPTNVAQYFSIISPGVRAHSPAPDVAWLASIPDQLKASGASEATIKAGSAGAQFSAGKLLTSLMHADLKTTAPSFPIPWCVIQGRLDLNAPTSAAQSYFEAMKAPKKAFMVIEPAGHFALATHQAEFIADLKKCPGVG